MRKIIVSNYLSLDGCFAGPNGEIDWFLWDDETAAYSKALLKSIDTLLFGRVTYELMASFWPTATTEDPVITEAMNNLPKVVFSKTLEKVGWTHARLASLSLAEEISILKQQPGKDLVIYGSGSIVSKLTQLGLIDDYRLFFNPVLLGKGKPLFKDLKHRINLKLQEVRTFSSGVVLHRYLSQK